MKDGGDAVCFANTNAKAWQGVVVVPKQSKENPMVLSELNRQDGTWIPLGAWGDLNFGIAPCEHTVIKFRRRKAE